MNKKRIKHFAFIALAFAAVMVACMKLNTIDIDQPQPDGTMAPRIQAGETATFVVHCRLDPSANVPEGRRLIVGMLAPRDWKIAENVTMSAQALEGIDPIVYEMKVIPNATQPRNMPGRTWPEALMERFGLGPNRYNDMEWVAWMVDEALPINASVHFDYDVTVKCKVGMSNLKACLGFVINHDDDGLSQDTQHFASGFSDLFTVYGGEGEEMDFTIARFNSVYPARILQNDLVTFTFNGDVLENSLIDADEVYLRGEAVDEDGVTYPCQPKLMPRETSFTHVYNCTFWPKKLFNVPKDKTIVAIRYEYTDAEGRVRINKSEEQRLSGKEPAEDNEPYTLNLRCD